MSQRGGFNNSGLLGFLNNAALVAVVLLVETNILLAQTYDVEDTIPPWQHTERTGLYMDSPLFDEKYKLLVYPACHGNDINIDAKIKSGSQPFNIEIKHDTITITLLATTFSPCKYLHTEAVIPDTFNLFLIMGNDTALYHVAYNRDNGQLPVVTIKESWFIELVPVMEIPENIFWIKASNLKTARILKSRISSDKLAEYIVLPEGYYRCLAGGYVGIKKNRNYVSNEIIMFFRKSDDVDPLELYSVINQLGKGKAVLVTDR